MKIAILGAGGLGRAAAKLIEKKKEVKIVAACDNRGFVINEKGISPKKIYNLKKDESVEKIGKSSDDSIGQVIKNSKSIEGILITLPNLPNEFIPSVAKRFLQNGYQGTFSDPLKRTQAMKIMFKMHNFFKQRKSTYLTGTGATPGLLSAAAVLAAQSFTKVDKVDIFWGVGISNWEEYQGTIREDIAHLPGYDVKKAKSMTDKEIENLLNKTNGILRFYNMEHADDILLQKAGIVESLNQVTVGGIMDTRHAKKPVTTTMTLSGTTFDGKKSSHKFSLGDETTMAANVLGPALGYLKRAIWLKQNKIYGVYGSTEFMPMFVK
ncbi:MAG TPA: saccharopine dehydrogenase-like oxidoreductase [Candidatus Nanoarchaeia archaeon]|nr:saccharopine dehydrogenase-like oxidoreductase [Candidatus Nanoarchaeia archaeon]